MSEKPPGREPQTPLAAELGWEPQDPLLVQLADARLDTADRRQLLDPAPRVDVPPLLEPGSFRSTVPAGTPQIVTLPGDVTVEQAIEWIRGCERLGIIEPSPAGHLFMPPGVW